MTMHIPSTNRLLTDIGSRISQMLASSGWHVCKTIVLHAADGELECCDCDDVGEGYVVAIWEDRSYPSFIPPLAAGPDKQSSAWVDVHELHVSVATCWPQFSATVPLQGDPRQTTALGLLDVRDALVRWLSSCARNMEQMLLDTKLNVWIRDIRAERAGSVGMECRGWELTMYVW